VNYDHSRTGKEPNFNQLITLTIMVGSASKFLAIGQQPWHPLNSTNRKGKYSKQQQSTKPKPRAIEIAYILFSK
jgi:hypothetical protein